MLGRDLDSAAALLRLSIAMSGDTDASDMDQLGLIYSLQGRFSAAIAQHRRALVLRGPSDRDSTFLATSLARAGQVAEARRIAVEMHELAQKRQGISLRQLAALDVALGDTTSALRWLSQEATIPGLAPLDIGVHPDFDGLHQLPAFKEILRTLRLDP